MKRDRLRFVRKPSVQGRQYSILLDDTEVVGVVRTVYLGSHIRRGRLQTEPWWEAVLPDGQPILDPRDSYPRRWMRRMDAATALWVCYQQGAASGAAS